MRRDRNGRFSKASDEGLNVSFNIPSLKTIIYWIVFIVFLMPWIIIVQMSLVLYSIYLKILWE